MLLVFLIVCAPPLKSIDTSIRLVRSWTRSSPAEALIERLHKMAVFVAINKSGQIVGTVACSVVHGEEGHIRGMAVRPICQGAGIAARLFGQVARELRRRKCTRCHPRHNGTTPACDAFLREIWFSSFG